MLILKGTENSDTSIGSGTMRTFTLVPGGNTEEVRVARLTQRDSPSTNDADVETGALSTDRQPGAADGGATGATGDEVTETERIDWLLKFPGGLQCRRNNCMAHCFFWTFFAIAVLLGIRGMIM